MSDYCFSNYIKTLENLATIVEIPAAIRDKALAIPALHAAIYQDLAKIEVEQARLAAMGGARPYVDATYRPFMCGDYLRAFDQFDPKLADYYYRTGVPVGPSADLIQMMRMFSYGNRLFAPAPCPCQWPDHEVSARILGDLATIAEQRRIAAAED
jgi:hypothetical protein